MAADPPQTAVLGNDLPMQLGAARLLGILEGCVVPS